MIRRARVVLGAAMAVVGALVISAESVHARSAIGDRRSGPPRAGARTTILVLGYANRSPYPNVINRTRARMAVRAARSLPGPSSYLCSGGPVVSPRPEASLLAEAIRSVDPGAHVVEESTSRTTSDNIRLCIPALQGADQIVVVSNELHAEEARAHLRELRPDLGARLVYVATYRAGELWWAKPIMAWIGLRKLRSRRRATRTVEQQ